MLRLLYVRYYLSRNDDAASRPQLIPNCGRRALQKFLCAASTVFVPEMCRLLFVSATLELSVIYRPSQCVCATA